MYLRLYIVIFSLVITLGIKDSYAEDSKKASNRGWPSSSSSSSKGDLYIDDDDLEGSGGNPEMKYDLEEASGGSGFGPDDEDGDVPEVTVQKGSGGTKVGSIDPGHSSHDDHDDRQDIRQRTGISKTHSTNYNYDGGETITNDNTNVNKKNEHEDDNNRHSNEVHIMNAKHEERATSFFAQPGILAAVIGGAVVGLLCAILVVMFIVYRMRKKDEGSYALDEPKRSPNSNNPYMKTSNREFYA